MKTKILLADDHQMIRDGLRKLLDESFGVEVVGEAADGRTIVELARTLKPNIVIMDINMPDMNGIEAARHITTENPYVKIIALTMRTDEHTLIEMFEAGASAYILKENAFKELEQAIQQVKMNKTYVSPTLGGAFIKASLNSRLETAQESGTLTHKEREVLQLIAEGKSNKEIADILGLSFKTVDTHRQHIMEKLNLHTVAALTKYAIREGITTAD